MNPTLRSKHKTIFDKFGNKTLNSKMSLEKLLCQDIPRKETKQTNEIRTQKIYIYWNVLVFHSYILKFDIKSSLQRNLVANCIHIFIQSITVECHEGECFIVASFRSIYELTHTRIFL